MQHNLRLIQLLLDLHDTIRILRILILLQILLELRERHLGVGVRPTAARELADEIVQNLAQQLVRHERRVLVVADDDAGDALAARVRVEGVRLLLDVLPLAGVCALRDRFAEQRHEFAHAGAREARVGSQVAFGAEFDGGLCLVFEDLDVGLAVADGGGVGAAYADVEELHLGVWVERNGWE